MQDRIESDNMGSPRVVGMIEENELHSIRACRKHTKFVPSEVVVGPKG